MTVPEYPQNEEGQSRNVSAPSGVPLDFVPKSRESLDSHDNPAVRPIKTFETDAAEFLKDKNASVADFALAEQKRRIRRATTAETVPVQGGRAKKSRLVLILSIFSLFFIVAGGTVIYVLITVQKERPVVVGTESVNTIIPADAKKEVDVSLVDPDRLLSALADDRKNTALSLGKILVFYFTEKKDGVKSLIRSDQFLALIGAKAPASFIRSIGREFLLGLHAFDGNQPFLILKTASFQQAYSGLLAWEKDLAIDLSPLFTEPEPASSAESTETILAASGFADGVLKNRDVRVLRNNAGKIVLLYSIIDKDTIVITTNEYTFAETLSRLTTKQLVR